MADFNIKPLRNGRLLPLTVNITKEGLKVTMVHFCMIPIDKEVYMAQF